MKSAIGMVVVATFFMGGGAIGHISAYADTARVVSKETSITDSLSADQLVVGLRRIGKFVSGEPGSQQLNENSAYAHGIDRRVIQLAQAIVETQNSDKNHSLASVAAKEAVQEFHEAVSRDMPEANKTELEDILAPHHCGDYDNPVPRSAPPRITKTNKRGSRKVLVEQGFHKTAGYACGASDPFGKCADDYTKAYGDYHVGGKKCEGATFRHQAMVRSNTSWWEQNGEPNPEIHSYIWPYWNWGNYVKWWHENH